MPTRLHSPAQERRPHPVAQLFWRLGRRAGGGALAGFGFITVGAALFAAFLAEVLAGAAQGACSPNP
jgi:hypothetical protein